jgi:hypothetical protein
MDGAIGKKSDCTLRFAADWLSKGSLDLPCCLGCCNEFGGLLSKLDKPPNCFLRPPSVHTVQTAVSW